MKMTISILCLLAQLFCFGYTYADEMQDCSKIWNSWGKDGQKVYLWGYRDGLGEVMTALMVEIVNNMAEKIPNNFYENIRVKTATLYDDDKLIEVITSLYKDPANSYILFSDMVLIASDSLSEKDISKRILQARKKAIETHELNRKTNK
jgi:hypothetical protein